MRTRALAAAGLAAALSLSALATTEAPAEGTIAASAARDGASVTFQGAANLADPGVSELPGFLITAFADEAAAQQLGLDLIGATIEEQEDASGLRFTWQLSSMPAEGLPEAVRYNWAFGAGDQTYQMQVKRSNLLSVTTPEDPVGHATELAEGDWWFQLRGACTDTYLPEQSPQQIAGCYHLGFYTGEVDAAAGTVSMELDYGQQDSIGRTVGATFQRGVPITEVQSANMSITASAQAVISNATTSQYLNGWGTYYPGTVVSIALGDASGPAGSYELLETDGDGTFAGAVDGDGSHLWVQACRGYQVLDGNGFTQPCVASGFPIG